MYTSCSDILSFYKEDLAGDTSSYIHARARVTGKSLHDTLSEVAREVVAALERVKKHLGEGPARDAWDSFERGYVSFHLHNPRYRLREVVGAGLDYLSVES